MLNDREKNRKIIEKILILFQEDKKEEVECIIQNLSPEKDNIGYFNTIIRTTYIRRNKIKNWHSKVDEFYKYHNEKKLEDLQSWFVGLI